MMSNEALIFLRDNGQKLKLSHAVILQMEKYRQDIYRKPEAGGILLGREIVDSKDIIVDSISTPLPGDKQTRFSFFRNAKHHQKIIEKTWHESKGTYNYLGEWHTHPEPLPSPSSTDLKDWKRKLKQDQFYSDYLYFVIIGIQQIFVWEGCKQTNNIIKLQKES